MRVLQLFLSLILLTTTCFGQYLKPLPGMPFVNRAHRLGRGLVAYLPMNERSGNKVFDLSGNGNTGSLVADTHFVPGKFGPALDFDKVGDYVQLPASNVILPQTSPWTIIVGFRADSFNNDIARIITLHRGAVAGTAVYMGLKGGEFTFQFGYMDAGSSFKNVAVTAISAGVHYIGALTYDGTDFKAYLDGILENIRTDSFLGFGSYEAKMGHYDGINNNYAWDGLLDFTVIYNRALSAGEIAEHYRELLVLFRKDNTALIASVAAPPAGGGQFIMIQMSMIPLFLIFTLVCFIRGKEIGK